MGCASLNPTYETVRAEDVFVHIRDVEGSDANELQLGDIVEFIPEKWEKGLQAKKVETVG